MPASPDDAQLDSFVAQCIPNLAVLYDRFANALDPFTPERDQAEQLFLAEVARLYDECPPVTLDSTSPPTKPDLRTFTKALIVRCRRYLKATGKPPSL